MLAVRAARDSNSPPLRVATQRRKYLDARQENRRSLIRFTGH
jgi:hypothetical protein